MSGRQRILGHDGGFTLVELLVSLALLAVMLALVGSTLRLGGRAWEATDRIDRGQSVAAARNLLTRQLTETLPLMRWDERGVAEPTFDGAADRVRFLSAMPSRDGVPAGLFSVTLKLIAVEGARQALGLELRAVAGAGSVMQPPIRAPVLVERVSSLAIRYYGPAEREAEPGWGHVWSGRTSLPLLVEVDLRFPPGDERTWPPLTVALKLGAQSPASP